MGITTSYSSSLTKVDINLKTSSNGNRIDKTIKARFETQNTLRTTHLERCRKCAELTIPSLLPPESADENTPLPTPFQSLGAWCVNNQSSKLLLTLLPPNTPFFKYNAPAKLVDLIVQKKGEEGFKVEVEKKLRNIEQDIMDYIESEGHRSAFYKMLRLLNISGNILLEMPKDSGLKVHRLDKYVTRRNPAGKPIEIILREYIDKIEVPAGIDTTKLTSETRVNMKKLIGLYTRCLKDKKGMWTVDQEICGQSVPGSHGTYTDDDMPFLALSINQVEGEDYGRGTIEEYLGDFISLESLMQSIVEGSAAAARILYLVRPGGVTNWKQVRDAKNLSAIVGRKDDIETLQLDKLSDFQITYQTIAMLKDRLSRAFLLSDSVQRQAERVTAQEIQFMAQQLEQSQGGIYTTLSQDLQRPYLIKVVEQMKSKQIFVNPLPPELKLTMTTGFEALGRGHELTKLDALLDRLTSFLPGDALQSLLGKKELKVLIDKYATALGVDTMGWIPTKEDIAAQEKQDQMMAMMEKLMDNPAIQDLVKQAGPEAIQQGMQQGAQVASQ